MFCVSARLIYVVMLLNRRSLIYRRSTALNSFMEDEKEQRIDQTVKVHTNLNVLVENYLQQIQYVLDLVIFSFAGAELVTENRYNDYSRFLNFQPSKSGRMDFTRARNEYEKWLVRNFLGEGINYTQVFLEECRTICAIYSISNRQIRGHEYNKAINEEKKKYHNYGLPKKLETLREKYSVYSDSESNILSLNKLRNCIVHRLGIVSERDVTEDDQLTIRMRCLGIFAKNPETGEEIEVDKKTRVEKGWSIIGRSHEKSKSFKLNESVSLDYNEMTHCIYTFFFFAASMKESITEFGKRLGIPFSESK